MEEEILQQEEAVAQEQDMLVEAPESVSEPVSQEGNTIVGGEALQQRREPLKSPLLTRQKKPLLSSKPKMQMSEEQVESLSEQIVYAVRGTTGQSINKQDVMRRISNGGLDAARNEVVTAEYTQRMSLLQQALDNALADNSQDVEQIAARLKELQEQKPNEFALEESATTEAMREKAADPEWAAIFEQDAQRTDEVQIEYEKGTLLHNYIQQKKAEADSDFDYGIDLVRGITSLDLLSKVAGFGPNFAEGMREFGYRYNNAKSLQEARDIIDEFEEEVRAGYVLGSILDVNPDFMLEVATTAFNATPEQRSEALVLGGVEGVLTLFGWGSLIRGAVKGGVKSVPPANSPETVKQTLDEMKENPEVVSDVILNQPPMSGVSSKYDGVNRELQKQQRALDDAIDNSTAPVIRTEMEAEIPYDGSLALRQENTSDNGIVSFIGTTKGNPFASEATAQRRAKQLGLPESNYSIVEENGGYAIRYETKRDAWNAPSDPPTRVGLTRRKVDNVDNWVDSIIHAKGRLSEGSFAQYESTVRSVWKNGIKPMRFGERKDLERTLVRLRDQNTEGSMNRWWSEDEFIQEYSTITGREPSERVVQGYQTYRQLSDFAWRVDNNVLYQQAKRDGYSTATISGFDYPVTARVVDSVADEDLVYIPELKASFKAEDLTGGVDKYDFFSVSPRDKSDLIEEGLLPLDGSKYVAAIKGTAKVTELNPIQLPYKAGGRVVYDTNSVFLKQLNVRNAGDGQRVRLRDKTLYRADSMAEAKEYAARWNKARLLAKQVITGQADKVAARAAFREFDVGELDDFLENAKAYGWDLDEPMQAVRHRESIASPSGSDYVDNTDELDFMVEGVGNRFSKRGLGVPHILGKQGDGPLDPINALSQSIDLSARNGSFSSFRLAALERFKDRFGKFLDVRPNAPLTDYIRAPVNSLGQQKDLVNAIEGHQRYLEDVMSLKYADERAWDRLVGKAAEWAFGSLGKGLGATVARSLEATRGFSPTAVARNIIFNLKMGLFNPATAPLQALQAPVIAATVPKFGIRSLTVYPLFRAALYGSNEFKPEILREFANKAKGLVEVEFLGDLEEAVLEFRRLGIDNFGSRMAYIDANTGSNVIGAARSSVSEAVDTALDKGRVFFNEGEMIPRAVAYMSSRARWLSDKTVNPKGLPATSDSGRQWIRNSTEKYVLGMSRSDIQEGFRGGLTGLIGQFQSFAWRASAAFLGREFTTAEKLRMATAYTLLYGGAGIPFTNAAIQWGADKYDSETLDYLAERGVVDGIASAVFGYETDMSSRAGIGRYWGDIWDMLTGNSTVMEVLGGPAGSTGSRFFDSVGDVVRSFSLMAHPDPSIITEKTLLAAASQATSFNNAYKMVQGWGTGTLMSNSGMALMPYSNEEYVGKMFGFPSFKNRELTLLFKSRREREQAIRDGVQDILTLMEERAKTSDPQRIEELNALISLRQHNNEQFGIHKDVTSRVLSSMEGDTLYSRMFREQLLLQMQAAEERGSGLERQFTPERLREAEESASEDRERNK